MLKKITKITLCAERDCKAPVAKQEENVDLVFGLLVRKRGKGFDIGRFDSPDQQQHAHSSQLGQLGLL
jgi:hypothetical protein